MRWRRTEGNFAIFPIHTNTSEGYTTEETLDDLLQFLISCVGMSL